MDDRSHLHDAEVLLCSMRSSWAMVLWILCRGLLDAVMAGVLMSLIVFLIFFFGFQITPAFFWYPIFFVLAYILVLIQRIRIWNHALFRITSERILLQNPKAFFHSSMRTIKWPQYQESHTGHKSVFDVLALSRPLCIKYGTADAFNELCFPSLYYASDLKHFLDKVDSAVRRNEVAAVHPFVAKPRGKRDAA